ncbi:hypothetical protein JZ751_003443 [Albula glossodonta]|uniref:Tetraspanin n=1 Tax=Albula glossodonta TaxID=121402 RepID=A0A8T2N7L9_9TELE|nr:hypothetical protein JZ751_003443 [Albula glossodonta]
MMLVGFFGCCGAVRESQCLLGSFFACLLVIFGAEVAAGVFGFLNKDKITEEVQNFYSKSINDNNNNGTTIVSIYYKVLKCCAEDDGSITTLCPDAASDTQVKRQNTCPRHADNRHDLQYGPLLRDTEQQGGDLDSAPPCPAPPCLTPPLLPTTLAYHWISICEKSLLGLVQQNLLSKQEAPTLPPLTPPFPSP